MLKNQSAYIILVEEYSDDTQNWDTIIFCSEMNMQSQLKTNKRTPTLA